MTSVDSPVEAPAVWLAVPATWFPLDLDPVTRGASIGRRLDERRVPAAARLRVRPLLEAASERASAAGASCAFFFVKVLGPAVAAASLLVSVVPGPDPDDPGGGPPGPAEVAGALAEHYGGAASELAGCPGARVRRRVHVEPGGDAGAGGDAEVLWWYVPHGSGRWIAVLTFSTPNVDRGDEFADAFDELAGTLRWTS